MIGIIPVNNGDPLAAIQDFLKRLLESGVVEALYVPLQVDGETVAPALVSDPSRLSQANPLAPLMPINGARAVSAITGKTPAARLGVVLRSCEIRALYELVKLQQASLEGVTVIGLDCPGTYELPDFNASGKKNGSMLLEYLAAAREGRPPSFEGMSLRPACQMCVQPVPDHADISLHLFGVDVMQGIPVALDVVIAERLSLTPAGGDPLPGHRDAVERVVAGRAQERQKTLSDIRNQLESNGSIASLFVQCIRCHNCMTVCPICYCKTCLFRTAAFDHLPEHYLLAAHQKGAVRMLGDTLLFHMTRLNHMSASCVSCGMCTSACPAEIPVGAIFSAIAEQVDQAFNYVPGRDLLEPLPLVTFQANEWTEIGEAR